MSRRPSPEQQARNDRVDRIVELFAAGYGQDYVCEQGLRGGWTRDDVLTVVKQRGWPLDKSGRLPLRMRPRRSNRPTGPAAHQPRLAAVALGGLVSEAAASARLDGETHTVGGAYTAPRPRPAATETPTEGTAPEASADDAAGTAPDLSGSGHGIAGPDAQPQVSPSRSRSGKDGGPGASDEPAGPPVTVTVCGLPDDAPNELLEALASMGTAAAATIAVDEADEWGWTWDPVTKSYVSAAPSDPVESPDTPVVPGSQPVDVLAAGLAHSHPAVRAKAKLVERAVDELCSALARHREVPS